MVHSTFAQGHVMGGRDSSPLGIPKSPSFHSGLDLVASASVDSLVAVQTSAKHFDNDISAKPEEGKGQRRNPNRGMQDTGLLPRLEGEIISLKLYRTELCHNRVNQGVAAIRIHIFYYKNLSFG